MFFNSFRKRSQAFFMSNRYSLFGSRFHGPKFQRRFFSSSSSSNSHQHNFWSQYNHYLDKYPLLTKAAQSAVIVAIGDVIAQKFIEEAKELDYIRLLRMSSTGLLLVGPTLHVWYGTLFKYIKTPGFSGAIMRMLPDQFIFAPIFIAVFSTFLFTLEGRLDELKQHLNDTMFDSMVVNWKIWIPAQIINFRFIPLHLQVLYVNFVALIWNTYLSYISHLKAHHHQET